MLLHALAALRERLPYAIGAVHINHGLQVQARDWELHCRKVCRDLGVPCMALSVEASAGHGESPEAAARAARYRALEDWLPAGHCLLTAQHQDDQAETLLLQLLRGSGVKGLAAMPRQMTLGGGYLLRPLLAFSRQALLDYAAGQRLVWIEDPSNQDVGLDRNYLRLRVMPELRKRWPAMAGSLSRSARHCAAAVAIMDQLAGQDIAALAGVPADTLRISGLRALSAGRQRNALRYWLCTRATTAPSTAVLARMVHDVLGSRRDANPCVRWGRHEVRRYRDHLYLLRQRPLPTPAAELEWDLRGPLELPHAGGSLTAIPVTGQGLDAAAVLRGRVQIHYRHGGERCRPAGRRHHHALKKLFQESGIPPWERARIPLIYIDNALAAVAGGWNCEPFAAAVDEPGLVVCWKPAADPDRMSPPPRHGKQLR